MNQNELFQYAKLSILWNNRLFALTRLLLFLTLLLMTGVSITNFVFPSLSLFATSALVMFELFFHYGIDGVRPATGSMTIDAAKVLISSKSIKELIENLKGSREVKFLLHRTGIQENELTVSTNLTIDAILKKAQEIAAKENDFIHSLYLFAGVLLIFESRTKLLFKKELEEKDLFHIVHWTRHHFGATEVQEIPKVPYWGRGIGEDWVTGWTLETKKYTVDITTKVVRERPRLVGREKEFQHLIEALKKSEKKNALLVGPSGVGKTTIISALAYESFLGTLPKELSHRRVLELLAGSLLAGAESQGKLEERIRDMLTELSHAEDVILYLPEMQHVVGGGGRKFDMSGILMQALRTYEIVIIGTVTAENYKTFIEPLTSFAELFETIKVEEPTLEEALRMLEEKAISFEKKHKVTFTYKAVLAAVSLSQRYLPYRSLPGKGIELLDEVAARNALAGKKIIEKEDVISLIEEKTKVPIGEPKEKERATLLHLEEVLHRRVVDQEEAIKTVSGALRRLRSGLTFENRPVGTFLFLGPTGVGKTETAKALSQVYFGSEEAMVRLDMSEYQHEDSVGRLLTDFPEKIIARPFSLVLLDEFEKAHSKILDVFLQVFEDGRLTDNRGRTVSFVNTIIIATSNAGSELIRERILTSGGSRLQVGTTESVGEKKKLDLKALTPELIDHLQRQGIFKTELLNRFDAIVVFEPLGEKEVQKITQLLLNNVMNLLKKKDITVSFDGKVVAKIAREGFNPQFGARPIRRFIQDTIEDLLSRKLLAQEIKRGDSVTFSTDGANNITLLVQ